MTRTTITTILTTLMTTMTTTTAAALLATVVVGAAAVRASRAAPFATAGPGTATATLSTPMSGNYPSLDRVDLLVSPQ